MGRPLLRGRICFILAASGVQTASHNQRVLNNEITARHRQRSAHRDARTVHGPLASGRTTGMLALSAATSVAAAEDDDDAEELYNPDPWEPVNRAVSRFNDTLDTYALRPVARGYDKVMPQFLNDGVTNVFNNLGEP